MPKRILFEGVTQEFPDDFTDEEIADALGGAHDTPAAAAPATPSGPTPALAVVPAAVTALNAVRPTTNYIAGKVAGGAGSGLINAMGRVAGGAAGAGLGAGTGGVGGAFGGAALGGYAGGGIARQIQKPIRSLAGLVAESTSTAPAEQVISPSVRSAAGQFMKGSSKLVDLPLPIGRRMVDAFGKMVPALDRASMVSSLYDQQPSDPNDTFLQSIVRKTPGVLKDPLGIGTGAGAFPINPFDHHYTADNYDFPVQHYKDDLIALRDKLIAYLGKK